ncbi:hypothetical protein SPURM210S_01905 [Streptomyces purpurascens]
MNWRTTGASRCASATAGTARSPRPAPAWSCATGSAAAPRATSAPRPSTTWSCRAIARRRPPWRADPLPATGGTRPEPVEQVRQLAPLDLRRTRLRAVTAEDYAALAGALPGVQRAAAEIRWTGSVQEAHVAIDAYGTADPSPGLLDSVAQALEAYRRIGHDLVVGPARLVPLDIALAPAPSRATSTGSTWPSSTACSAADGCPADGSASSTPTR